MGKSRRIQLTVVVAMLKPTTLLSKADVALIRVSSLVSMGGTGRYRHRHRKCEGFTWL